MRILPVYLMVAIFVAPVLSVFGQSNFEVSFDDQNAHAKISGISDMQNAEPEIEAILTHNANGQNGEAAIIALEALEDFGALAGGADGTPVESRQGLRYFCPEVLNNQAGEIQISFSPFYNGTYATPKGGGDPIRLYYLFDSGTLAPEGESQRAGGIQIYIKHVKKEPNDTYMLNAMLTLASGEVIAMARPVAANPRQWHTVVLRWNEVEAVLEFDEKVVEKKNIPEELTEFQEFFTIGGSWYGTWPIQGLIDDVKVIGGY